MNPINNSFNALPRQNTNNVGSAADFAQKMAAMRASKLAKTTEAQVPKIAQEQPRQELNIAQTISSKPEAIANKPIRLGMIIDLKV